MLRASALYIVIIIAVIIAIFSASLISTAYFYRLEYQKNLRLNKLSANLSSAIALSLSSKQAEGKLALDLFGEETDSVLLDRELWGLFTIATVKAFIRKDTLKKAFFIGNLVDDKVALYLSDEDRPLSVSGSTAIRGEAMLPKSGIKQAYVEGRPYTGAKLVYGNIKNSDRQLPALNEEVLSRIQAYLSDTAISSGSSAWESRSFYEPVLKIQLKNAFTLSGEYSGKQLIVSDTIVRISRDAKLKDIIVAAPAIIVESGFNGICQLFAVDSVVVGANSNFGYPSAIGVIKPEGSKVQARIQLGENCKFQGILFSQEKNRSDLQTIVSLGKNSVVEGEVYAKGYVKMEKPLSVFGRVSCNRFIIQTPTTLYENYLLDITIDHSKRSKYYLSSAIFKTENEKREVLKWLD